MVDWHTHEHWMCHGQAARETAAAISPLTSLLPEGEEAAFRIVSYTKLYRQSSLSSLGCCA